MKKTPFILLIFLTVLIAGSALSPTGQDSAAAQTGEIYTYLPVVVKRPTEWGAGFPIMLGSYVDGWLANQSELDSRLHALDNWADDVGGAHLSIAGTFIDIELDQPSYYATHVTEQLDMVWENGYTPFVNLNTVRAAYMVARGDVDTDLRRWAQAYADFSRNGQRIAYIAPLPEMNGNWVPFGRDPINFKLAYIHIQAIFAQEGVSLSEVHWVFAPNGWSRPQDPPFEDYYPGDNIVDVVGYSAYNFGYCAGGVWQDPVTVFGPYLPRMRAMAPDKPIFIAQTASSTSGGNKDQWLRDAYGYLKDQQGVKAIIYFNIDKECDWAFYKTWGSNQRRYSAYREAVADPAYGYVSPNQSLDP